LRLCGGTCIITRCRPCRVVATARARTSDIGGGLPRVRQAVVACQYCTISKSVNSNACRFNQEHTWLDLTDSDDNVDESIFRLDLKSI
jgi:hypothetical protein